MTAHKQAALAGFLRFSGAALLAGAVLCGPLPASALSQIGADDASGEAASPSKQGIIAVPLPPLSPPAPPVDEVPPPQEDAPEGMPAGKTLPPPAGTPPMDAAPRRGVPDAPQPSEASDEIEGARLGEDEESAEPATVLYDEDQLPAPVRDLRRRLIEIAKAGDIAALGPYLETGEEATVLSFGGVEGDPVAFLKSVSADGEGRETLAILLEILESGYVHLEFGTEEEIFVWPYFAQVTLDNLTPPQLVELFEIVTAGDFEEMKAFGAYNFYRLGITPDGRLRFFVAGD